MIGCQCEVCHSIDYRDKRLRTSVHISVNEKDFVIDTGPDFRQQMLRERIKKLDAVIFTHEHKDHTAGMDDIRAFNFMQQKDIPVYARKQVIDQLKREFAYVFSEKKYPGVPSIEVHEVTGEPFQIEGIPFIPINVLHYKLPVFGYRIGDFSYITDANYIAEDEKEKLRGSKILVLNALQIRQHISHFTLQEAIDLVNEIKPEKAYFIHMSHRIGLHQAVSMLLPPNMELAYDGLKIEI